jgi:hypothetical protein
LDTLFGFKALAWNCMTKQQKLLKKLAAWRDVGVKIFYSVNDIELQKNISAALKNIDKTIVLLQDYQRQQDNNQEKLKL